MPKPANMKVQLTGIWVGAIVSIATSVIALIASQGAQSKADAVRVEIDTASSNSNKPASDGPWEPWFLVISERTTYVGVTRYINFRKPFESIPQVAVSLSLIQVEPMDVLLADTVLDQPIAEQADYARKLRNVHVVAQTGKVSKDGCEVRVMIGLPSPAAQELRKMLLERQPSDYSVTAARTSGKLTVGSSGKDLGERERWLVNFSEVVGTIDFTWVATAES